LEVSVQCRVSQFATSQFHWVQGVRMRFCLDDANAFYDRSLGAQAHGTTTSLRVHLYGVHLMP
jgi:hypothetical protein